MKIGIIGSSLSGLVAGRKLALAGHDVTVIEKSRRLGGLLGSLKKEELIFDYGVSSIISSDPVFHAFIEELKDQGILKEWTRDFGLFEGTQLHHVNPNRPRNKYHVSEQGVNAIARYLSRWVDLKTEEQAGGLTHIGTHRTRKRSWMINLTDISVFECDAVIIATPAPQAYGILQTTQDETPSRRIIRHIDEVIYKPAYSLMVTYNEAVPDWEGIECEGAGISWIGNESSKIDNPPETALVIRSSGEFARRHLNADPEMVNDKLLEEASYIAEDWIIHPRWSNLHFWKYYEAVNPINDYFLEMEMEEAPLALIGDYLGSNSVQNAYLSGYYLAEYWINKFEEVKV